VSAELDVRKPAPSKNWRAKVLSGPARQTDPRKLARKVGVRPARDNALVPDQKEHRDEGLAV